MASPDFSWGSRCCRGLRLFITSRCVLAACFIRIGFVSKSCWGRTFQLSSFQFIFQDELYIAQEEEKQHAVAQFDLGMKPKLKQSDRTKSLSLPSIHAVKPVESAIRIAFDSPKVANKKKPEISSLIMNVITASNRLQKLDDQQGRKRVCGLFFICKA